MRHHTKDRRAERTNTEARPSHSLEPEVVMQPTNAKEKPFTLVVGVDFSPLSDGALLAAHNLAQRFPGSRVHAIHVVPSAYVEDPGPLDTKELEEETLVRLHAHLKDHGLAEGVTAHALVGSPLSVLTAAARSLRADVIVVGTHGRKGLSHALFGSVAESVMRHAPCSVLAVRARELGPEEKIEPPRPGQDAHESHARARTHYEGPNEALQGFGMGALSFRP